MEQIVKVINIFVGKYDTDSIIATIDDQLIEICFNKEDNVSQYLNKEIKLIKTNGVYKIEEIDLEF